MSSAAVILTEAEYCHILNNDDGVERLVDGPARISLRSNEVMTSKPKQKILLVENQYVEIRNPYDHIKGVYNMGGKKVVQGPAVFSLYPHEVLLKYKPNPAHVLSNLDALHMQALIDTPEHKAGEKWIVKGPAVIVPKSSEKVLEVIKALTIGKNQGIYVRHRRTNEVRLIRGPATYLLDVEEQLFKKYIPQNELRGLANGRASTNEEMAYSFRAVAIAVEQNECMMVLNFQKKEEKVVVGPTVHVFEPFESVKVLSLSGGTPKKENVHAVTRLRLGPDFMTDEVVVRTKDNAVLKMKVSFKYQFVAESASMSKVFSLNNFVGLACRSLNSRIRERSSQHYFEDFNSNVSSIVNGALFKDIVLPNGTSVHGMYYPENCLLITTADVKEVVPVDAEIAALLNESLKTNMNILCNKLEDSSKLDAEKDRVQNEAEIARLQSSLMDVELKNREQRTVGKAEIDAKSIMQKAGYEAAILGEQRKLQIAAQLDAANQKMQSLHGNGTTGADRYLEMKRIQSMSQVREATIIPAGMKTVFLPPHADGNSSGATADEVASSADSY